MSYQQVPGWRTTDGKIHPDEATAAREQAKLELLAACNSIMPGNGPTLARALVDAPNADVAELVRQIKEHGLAR